MTRKVVRNGWTPVDSKDHSCRAACRTPVDRNHEPYQYNGRQRKHLEIRTRNIRKHRNDEKVNQKRTVPGRWAPPEHPPFIVRYIGNSDTHLNTSSSQKNGLPRSPLSLRNPLAGRCSHRPVGSSGNFCYNPYVKRQVKCRREIVVEPNTRDENWETTSLAP